MTWRWPICSNSCGAGFSLHGTLVPQPLPWQCSCRGAKAPRRLKPAPRIISFRFLAAIALLLPAILPAAQLKGQVELTNSKDPVVRRNRDYAGVVIWLEPVGRSAPFPPSRRAEMKQQDKTFKPHVVAVPVGGTVDFPNLD